MLKPLSGSDSKATLRYLRDSGLSLNERDLFNYFLEKISFSRVPVSVPLRYPAYKLDWTIPKTKYILNKLIKRGYLERFTSYNWVKGRPKKVSWYRIKEPLT